MTDWKALCEELLGLWDAQPLPPYKSSWASVIARTRAAIAADRARWGHHPAPPAAGEVAELVSSLHHTSDALRSYALHGAADACTRAADLLEQCYPAPPAAGEVAELVKCLRIRAASLSEVGASLSQQGDAIYFTRAADLLERLASPACVVLKPSPELIEAFKDLPPGRIELLPEDAQVIEPTERTILVPARTPVPVSERPWEREGWCDEEGRCWWGRQETDDWYADWTLSTYEDTQEFCTYNPMTVCLPAHALPLPAGEVQP